MRGSTAGLADGIINPPAGIHVLFLYISDIIFSSCVLAPLIVIYWRGTWNLSDYFLNDNPLMQGAITSLGIGIIGHMFFTMLQEKFRKSLDPNKHRFWFYFCSRSYTYFYGIVCVNGWRAGWILLDEVLVPSVLDIFVVTFIAAIVLALLRGIRNISATPFSIADDSQKEYFTTPTMFKTGSQEPGLFILDCIFSVLVIGTLVVIVWRGMCVLCDILIYPDNKVLAGWAALAIGYGIVAITFLLQPIMRWACDRLTGILRIAVADVFLCFSFIGTINVWRGFWGLLDVYLMPDTPLVGDIISHFAGFIILALLNCSNSVLVRGVYIDAEEPAGQCVIFPIYYVRLFFQKERTKKQKRLMEALEHTDQSANNKLLLEKSGKMPIIIKNNNSNSIKSIELTAMLDKVTNINEIKNIEQIIRRSSQ